MTGQMFHKQKSDTVKSESKSLKSQQDKAQKSEV